MTDLVPTTDNRPETVLALYNMGADAHRIAGVMREDIAYVRRIIYKSKVSTTFTEPEDKELADAMRNLAWRAYEEALDIFEYGTIGERFALTKTILSRTASMVGQETTTRYDDMRTEFEEMIGSVIRGSENILDEPLPEPPYDPDDD